MKKAFAVLARLFFLAGVCFVFGVTPARAFLGSDERALSFVRTLLAPQSEKITAYPDHTVHEYAVVRGVIRAYVSPSGEVYAYTGHNQMGHPPAALLGPYLKEYQDAIRQARLRFGRRPLFVNSPHIRAGISGPQGSLSWYIYLQELPAGVGHDEIQ